MTSLPLALDVSHKQANGYLLRTAATGDGIGACRRPLWYLFSSDLRLVPACRTYHSPPWRRYRGGGHHHGFRFSPTQTRARGRRSHMRWPSGQYKTSGFSDARTQERPAEASRSPTNNKANTHKASIHLTQPQRFICRSGIQVFTPPR